MSTEEKLSAAYESVRLADLGKRGADSCAADAARVLETAKAALEVLIRHAVTREVAQ
jgi:hypothetical protein